ncbi:transcriptional regulator [Saccharomonospora piscinae]|uniref:transcriptional regulator n=1 Tax=Saccharomonospora piscinae TaxID=687388 RepID=UPI0004651AA8|nr:transcriptional regulator [Saccharomonospora piscinae]
MTEPFGELAALDKLVHEPARLAILTALEACEQSDFVFLQRITGLSKGNLSAHLAKLEAEGLVDITKHFAGKRPETWLALTDGGRHALETHWDRLSRLRAAARRWTGPPESPPPEVA